MDNPKVPPQKEFPLGIDQETEEQYAFHSNLLQQFTSISSIDKAWLFKSHTGKSKFTSKFQISISILICDFVFLRLFLASSEGMMFSVSQPNLLANKKRKFVLSSTVTKRSDGSVTLQWAPFPVEMTGVSVMVPSPSGNKLLIVRNAESEGPCRFEIWSSSCVEKEFLIPQSKHGSVYADGW